MTEKIKQFDTWLSTAESGDKYTYFTGNLAYESGRIDGYPLRQLKKHIMDKCCKWDLDISSKKPTNGKILFKPEIRLVQKAQKKYWDEKEKNILNDSDYMAIKL